MIDNKLTTKEKCTGCYACSNICPKKCISMELDKEGFSYPTVDYSSCIKCNKCVNACPVINNLISNYNPIALACINKDEEIRLESSSGGIFSLVAEKVIAQGGVVFGAGFNDKFLVEHSFVETKEELPKLRGSKYVQSQIGGSLKQAQEYLNAGRLVLFTGTPCQIAGLKSYLGKPHANLLTMDIICHGVPSPLVWRKYVEYREAKMGAPAQSISFRRKDEGWKQYSVSFLFKNGLEYRQNLRKDLYMKAFLLDVCLRPSCYKCNFKGFNRHSDITMADFWGIQNVLPEMDDDKGTSLIFINSPAGKRLFEEIKHGLRYKEVDIQSAVKYNAAAIKSPNLNKKRHGFMEEKDSLAFDTLVKKYCYDPLSTRLLGKLKAGLRKLKLLKSSLSSYKRSLSK